jgi:hypothetical protein
MKLELIMILALALISLGAAVPESTTAGPYTISFDLNTTLNYTIQPQEPFARTAPDVIGYPLILMSNNTSWAGIAVYQYKNQTDSTRSTEASLLGLTMIISPANNNVSVFERPIDGKEGLIAVAELPTGEMNYRAWYWLDSKSCDCGPVTIGMTKVEIISLYPANVTASLLSTLHVEGPGSAALAVSENLMPSENATTYANETATLNQTATIPPANE